MTEPVVKPYEETFREGVVRLWRRVFADDRPWNESNAVIDAKRRVDPDLYFVAISDAEVIALPWGGYDGHRGWVYAVAVAPAFRGKGVARRLMADVEEALLGRGCVKLNLQVRADKSAAVNFYESLGYRT